MDDCLKRMAVGRRPALTGWCAWLPLVLVFGLLTITGQARAEDAELLADNAVLLGKHGFVMVKARPLPRKEVDVPVKGKAARRSQSEIKLPQGGTWDQQFDVVHWFRLPEGFTAEDARKPIRKTHEWIGQKIFDPENAAFDEVIRADGKLFLMNVSGKPGYAVAGREWWVETDDVPGLIARETRGLETLATIRAEANIDKKIALFLKQLGPRSPSMVVMVEVQNMMFKRIGRTAFYFSRRNNGCSCCMGCWMCRSIQGHRHMYHGIFLWNISDLIAAPIRNDCLCRLLLA